MRSEPYRVASEYERGRRSMSRAPRKNRLAMCISYEIQLNSGDLMIESLSLIISPALPYKRPIWHFGHHDRLGVVMFGAIRPGNVVMFGSTNPAAGRSCSRRAGFPQRSRSMASWPTPLPRIPAVDRRSVRWPRSSALRWAFARGAAGVEPAQPAKPPGAAGSLGLPPLGLRPQPPGASPRAQSHREAPSNQRGRDGLVGFIGMAFPEAPNDSRPPPRGLAH